MSRNSGMMVKLIFEALISDSPLALSGFTPCSCDSRADPFQTQPLRSIVKERFLFVTVQHIQGPSHPHCKQIPSTQHHRPMGCNGSSQFTMQDAVEDWRKHQEKKVWTWAVAMHKSDSLIKRGCALLSPCFASHNEFSKKGSRCRALVFNLPLLWDWTCVFWREWGKLLTRKINKKTTQPFIGNAGKKKKRQLLTCVLLE